ncbi:amidohydrolase family protein [Nakamurella lactea]|uniref:amidohydrolase family protein n=1 Tax=Nakamurella lactea TaxID=459515 RepID=UPI0003FCFF54|nr:amidohydrolase/deacetylase family metallohydrolase [Nakamurella lactea]
MDELHIIGGRLIDPAGGLDAFHDLAIKDGRIRAVGELDTGQARQVLDATGLLVTPGLIDMHTHLHAGGSFWGLEPDPVAWYTGVTHWVDAGSVGAYGMAGFLEARKDFRVNTSLLLHISAQGLSAQTGESRDLAFLDVDALVAAAANRPDIVKGIKVRMDGSTVGDNGLQPLRTALAAGEATGLPLMMHIGPAPFSLDQLVDLLRPGDILTHCAGRTADGILRPGRIRDSLREAHRRGVIFDIGHGAGGFNFEVAEAYLAQSLPPHVISTDLHALSASGPAFDLPTVIAKQRAIGMSLVDAIRATTATPAQVLGLAGGTLAVGSAADVAVFRLVDGPFAVADTQGATRTAPERLVNVATLVAGNPLPPALPPAPPTWVNLSPAQRVALKSREQRLRDMLTEQLVPVDGVADPFRRESSS